MYFVRVGNRTPVACTTAGTPHGLTPGSAYWLSWRLAKRAVIPISLSAGIPARAAWVARLLLLFLLWKTQRKFFKNFNEWQKWQKWRIKIKGTTGGWLKLFLVTTVRARSSLQVMQIAMRLVASGTSCRSSSLLDDVETHWQQLTREAKLQSLGLCRGLSFSIL